MQKFIQSLVIVVALITGSVALAEPTVQDIYRTSQTDRAAALNMINEVIKKHPNSSRAYFVKTEILLSMNKKSQAKESFLMAEKLDPKFAYAKSETVARVKTAVGIQSANSFFDKENIFLVGGILIAGILVIWLIVRRKTPTYPNYMPNSYNRPITPYNPYTAGAQPGQAQPTAQPQSSGPSGSGIMGSLATGAAMGAGAVAGATLVNHLLKGNEGSSGTAKDTSAPQYVPTYTPDDNFGVDSAGSWDSGDSGSDNSDSGSDW